MEEKKEMTFEEAMKELEQILQSLESGMEDLNNSLKLYEEGVGLIRNCTQKLDSAEQTVKMLQMSPDGKAVLTDFESGEATE